MLPTFSDAATPAPLLLYFSRFHYAIHRAASADFIYTLMRHADGFTPLFCHFAAAALRRPAYAAMHCALLLDATVIIYAMPLRRRITSCATILPLAIFTRHFILILRRYALRCHVR